MLTFGYGTVVCFFGGTFPTLFAAIQAAEYGGRRKVLDAVHDLSDEAMIIIEESKKDDLIDIDGNGKQDVKEMTGVQLLKRKTLLVLQKMDPERIDNAVASIYKVYVTRKRSVSSTYTLLLLLFLSNGAFVVYMCIDETTCHC